MRSQESKRNMQIARRLEEEIGGGEVEFRSGAYRAQIVATS